MFARRLLPFAAILLVLIVPHVACAAIDASTMTLQNGLTVIVAPIHAAPVVTVGVLYKVGSRNETPTTTGVAHQVEHMMFKGTTDLLKPGDIDRRFIDNNAFTDQDSTYYYESFEKNGLGDALQIEADRMVNAAIDPAQLVSENAVVVSELDGGNNNPSELLAEQVVAAAVQVHQYHWPVIGWKNVVKTLGTRRDLVYDFYTHHYTPQNAVLVIAGDVDPDATRALVHKYFDSVAPRALTPLDPIVEPPQHGVRHVNLRGPATADHVEMAYRVPGAYSEDGYALTVLDAVLAGGHSSRLSQALVDSGYATDLTTTPNGAVDPYVYTIETELERGVSADMIRSIVEREVGGLVDSPPTAAEMARAKKQVIAAYVFDHDGVEALAQELALWQAWTGDWRNDTRYLDRINAVTAAQVRDAAKRYLTTENLTFGIFTATHGWAGQEFRPARDLALRFPKALVRSRSTDLVAVDAQPELPARFTLANGLVIIIQENHANPSAFIEADTGAGSAFDAASQSGLAALTQEMLMRGTRERPYEQLQRAIDGLGISLDTTIDISDAVLSTQALAQDEPKAMDLLADVLLHPAFDSSEFEVAQQQLVSDRLRARDRPNLVAREILYRNLYPSDSPWSRPSEGTADGLNAVRLKDTKAFYRTHYGPNDTVIVVVGDVNADAVRTQIAQLFGGWHPAAAPRPRVSSTLTPIDATRTLIKPIEGKVQVEVFGGSPGIAADAPDFEAAQLMNFILGGGSFVSRLLHQVRDVDGYVYAIGTHFTETAAGAGPWTLHFGADPSNTHAALADAIDQMRVLQRNGVTDDELAEYRRLAVDDAITSELNNRGIAQELMRDELLGRGLDYPRRLSSIYATITPAQIKAAAQKYLHPDNLLVSAAGPKF